MKKHVSEQLRNKQLYCSSVRCFALTSSYTHTRRALMEHMELANKL